MKALLVITFASFSLWGYGQGVPYWKTADQNRSASHHNKPSCHTQSAPRIDQTHQKEQKLGSHGSHGNKVEMFTLGNQGSDSTSIRLIRPDLSSETLSLEEGNLKLPKATSGGFYALIAEENTTDGYFSAVRYISAMGKPSKVSPEKLTDLPKTVLEIVPSPLHREHDRYTASKSYRFIVTFMGKPLPMTNVILETQKTGAKSFMTDSRGEITVSLPNDFTDATPKRSENKPSEFLLSVSHAEGGKTYLSTFSMPYYVNPNDFWQSQSWGAGAAAFGFFGGMILYSRFRKGSQNG